MAIGTVTAERSRRAGRRAGRRTQPRFGAIDTSPSSRRTTPATATPIPMIGPSSRARSSPARARRSATTSSTESCLRGRSMRIWSIRLPPSPTIAAAIESTRISRLSTTAPVGTEPDERRGTSGRPETDRVVLGDHARVDQLADERADRAPRQPRRGDEVGAGLRPQLVQAADDGAQVGTMRRSRFAVRRQRGRVRTICDPFLQTLCQTRTWLGSCQVGGPEGGVGAWSDGGERTRALGRSCPRRTSGCSKVIPGLRRSPRSEVLAIASREDGRAAAAAKELSIPRAHGTLRGAPRRPGRRRGLHPAAQPPPRRVDDRGGASRQARPVREAAGPDRGGGPGAWSTPAGTRVSS